MDETEMVIEADGTVTFIHSDDVAESFRGEDARTRRASHVEPDGIGGWTADLTPVGGPVLGPFARRDAALRAEMQWLRDAMSRGRVEAR